MLRFRLDDDTSTTNDTPIKVSLGIEREEPKDIYEMLERMGASVIGGFTLPAGVVEAYGQMTKEQQDEFIDDLVEFLESEG